jgi:hypothetical protein
VTADLIKQMKDLHDSMMESARDCFSDVALGHLRCLIRLAFEFHDFCDTKKASQPEHDLEFVSESIFAGIDSYLMVNATYRVLTDAKESDIRWDILSRPALISQFEQIYQRFVTENNFSNKSRMLLDLYKIQAVFAGAFHE